MKKISKLILSVFMCASMVACSSGNGGETGKYTAGTYIEEADGFGGKVTVTITTDAKSITDVKCEGPDETETIGGAALEELAEQINQAILKIDAEGKYLEILKKYFPDKLDNYDAYKKANNL